MPIATALVIKFVEAYFRIDASPGVDGFLMNYEFIDGARDLDGGFTFHDPRQYVPRQSLYVQDLTGVLDVRAGIKMPVARMTIPPFGLIFNLLYPLFVPLPYVKVSSGLFDHSNFDWWDMGGGFANFMGDPDYMSNNPWDIWPLAHSQGSHLYPFGPLPPMLAAAPATTAFSAPPLVQAVLAPLWAEAARRWAAAGATPEQIARALAVTPTVRNLGGLYLGATVGGSVYIDDDTAGWGWFIDPTPRADEEFGPGEAAAGRMDLLTVLSHEMGRLLWYDIGDAPRHPSMSLTLVPGARLGDSVLAVDALPERPFVRPFDFALSSPLGFADAAGTSKAAVIAPLDDERYPILVETAARAVDPPVRSEPAGVVAPYFRWPLDDSAVLDLPAVWVG